MGYQGEDRRKSDNEIHVTIEVLKNDMEHIKGAVDKIAKSMEEANKARIGWWMALTGMFLTILVQTSCFVFFLGGALKQIKVNTGRIMNLETIVHQRMEIK